MKLQRITNGYYLIFSLVIIIIAGYFAFLIFQNVINEEFNKKLLFEKDQLIYELNTYEDLRENYYLNIGDKIEIQPLNLSSNQPIIIRDTLMFDDYAKRELMYRQVQFTTEVDGVNYLVLISKSLFESEQLIKGVGEIMIILMLGIILSLAIMNQFIFNKIWAPFYKIMAGLQNFNIKAPYQKIEGSFQVSEFEILNKAVSEMIAKIQKDYYNLKEFTENTSHELQTPLAVIKSKTEMLLQSKDLNEKELDEIQVIYRTTNRLSKLNQSLALLSKIESDQFEANEIIIVSDEIDTLIKGMSDLIEFKQLNLERNYKAKPKLLLNKSLAQILIENILSNAIKHNIKGGFIKIVVNTNELLITNSGQISSSNANSLFQRFRKDDKTSESHGLGLSIVKAICDYYQIKVSYTIRDNKHKISIQF